MKKFSRLRSEEEETFKREDALYSDGHINIVKWEDWSILNGKDTTFCIPFLVEENKFIIRQEYIPSFKYVDGQELHLALVGGGIEIGETPEVALTREIQEEAGIVLRDNYIIEFIKPLFLGKHSSIKVHLAIIPLTSQDYTEIPIKGDGSKIEKMSQTAKVDLKYLNSLNASDILTEYMIMKFKEYLNL